MIESSVLIAVIIGVVQVAKIAKLPSRFAPLLALALGVCGTVFFLGFSPEVVFQGIVAGLSASGLYSGAKAVVNG